VQVIINNELSNLLQTFFLILSSRRTESIHTVQFCLLAISFLKEKTKHYNIVVRATGGLSTEHYTGKSVDKGVGKLSNKYNGGLLSREM